MIHPLLAAKKPKEWTMDQFLDHIDKYYPLIATPKLDGFRCQTSGALVPAPGLRSVPLTRTLKDIPNKYMQQQLGWCPPGLDGELVSGTFQETQSAVMTVEGQPGFLYYVFDSRIDEHAAQWERQTLTYEQRLANLRSLDLPPFCIKVFGITVNSREELLEYEGAMLGQGHEGVMLRPPGSRYKPGRSTLKEFILVALKRTEDAEGVVVGFTEKMRNCNELRSTPVGNRRSSHQENMLPLGTLGALIVRFRFAKGDTVEFQVGTGIDESLRQKIWDNRQGYLGQVVKFKYQTFGVKEKPRSPVFLGFRSKIDL